jgi:NitT/TauT family transport system substrate-binding protein
MEALLAKEVDVAYVGPSPAVNTYLKSGGKALRILAGACSGGASLIAREDLEIRSIRDLDHRRVAVPQFGGTQDVSLRHFLDVNGLAPQDRGGTVEVLPIKNPDILALFISKQIDAAWVPEPWASRLKKDAHAHTVVDERDLWPNKAFTTTVLVARTEFMQAHPLAIEAILRAHLATVAWLNGHPEEAQSVVNSELKRLTGKALAKSVLQEAWSRLRFTDDPNRANILEFTNAAAKAGYLKGSLNLDAAFDPSQLALARRQKGLGIASW